MLLTIGMATYDDYVGTWFTLTLLHHELMRLGQRESTEIVVVDNKPDSSVSVALRDLCADMGARYVAQAKPIGTGPARERIFTEARGDWVLVLDSHVWLPDFSLPKLFEWLPGNDSKDFYQGVCRRSKMYGINRTRNAIAWTHWDVRWGEDGLYGKAAIRSGSGEPSFIESEPFEIQYGGLGLFLCRKDAWLGFHPNFRGFGVEGYLQAKWRHAGRKCWCLPWLHWVHCFQPRGKSVRPNNWVDRTNNYLWWHQELGTIRLTDLKRHHVETKGRTTAAQWQQLLQEVGVDEAATLAREAAESQQQAQAAVAPLAVNASLTAEEQQTLTALECRHRGRRSGTVLCNVGCPSQQSQPCATFDCRRHGLVTLSKRRSDLRACVICQSEGGHQ